MTLSRDVINDLPFVEGVLNYLAPMAERPINLAYDPPPGVPRSTGVSEAHRMTIFDVRPVAARLSLDSEGLALVTHSSAVRDFYDEDELRRVYFPKPSASSPKSPAPLGCWCSITPFAVVSGAASTGRLGRRASRSRLSTTTIRSPLARNVSAI
jgi:hypothetical protein